MRISDWSSDMCSSDLDLAAADGAPDRHILQGRGIDRQRVLLQHGEIGIFAGLDAADQMIHMQRVGGADGNRRQGISHRQALFRPKNAAAGGLPVHRSEEHTSELQSLMRISYAVFCLKKKKYKNLRK